MREAALDPDLGGFRPALLWVYDPSRPEIGFHPAHTAFSWLVLDYEAEVADARSRGFSWREIWEHWGRKGGDGYHRVRTGPTAVDYPDLEGLVEAELAVLRGGGPPDARPLGPDRAAEEPAATRRIGHLPGRHDQDDHAGKNRRPIDVRSPRPQILGTAPDLRQLFPEGTPGREHVRAAKVVVNKRGKRHIVADHPERELWARENSDAIRAAIKKPQWVSSKPRFHPASGHYRLELGAHVPGMTGTKREYVNVVLSLANLPGQKESRFHQLVTAHPAPRRYFYERTASGEEVLKARWRPTE